MRSHLPIPIGSMGLAYVPRWMVGKYTNLMDPISIWCLEKNNCMPSFLVWTFEIQNICALGSQNIKPMQVLILRNMGEGCGFPWRIYVKNQKEQVSELSPNSHDIILFCLWIVSETPGSFSTIYVYHIFAMYIYIYLLTRFVCMWFPKHLAVSIPYMFTDYFPKYASCMIYYLPNHLYTIYRALVNIRYFRSIVVIFLAKKKPSLQQMPCFGTHRTTRFFFGFLKFPLPQATAMNPALKGDKTQVRAV